ncbi:GntR family transcriptional regulator [Chelativorans xinjiangense]|uniref:GntR family transcriptional regulator n=1 Tax=Chelativorans xinjiangense TaxID=2681485 RepID=UPI00135CE224|nr:GntR family transcriptional regulator [Chelativorans xinjiangense]
MELPTRTSHLYRQIHDILWEKILHGEIEPLERLKDVEWAQKLGVSRTPVREAMRKMEQEGILRPLSQGGYEVRPVSDEDRRELYLCRAALEAVAVREAAGKAKPRAIKKLERYLHDGDEAIRKGDIDHVFELNTAFHRELIDLSQNKHLIGLCNTVQKLVHLYRSARLNRVKTGKTNKAEYLEHLAAEQREHHAILDAVKAGEGETAARLIERHLLKTVQEMHVDP